LFQVCRAATAPGARKAAHRHPAPGSDIEKKRLLNAVTASRLAGGGQVTMQPDGSITIEVRHSSEAPPPVIEKTKALLMRELEVVEERQEQWATKVSTKVAKAAAAGDEPSKRSRKRAARKKKDAEARAAQETHIQELQQRLANAGTAATAAAEPTPTM